MVSWKQAELPWQPTQRSPKPAQTQGAGRRPPAAASSTFFPAADCHNMRAKAPSSNLLGPHRLAARPQPAALFLPDWPCGERRPSPAMAPYTTMVLLLLHQWRCELLRNWSLHLCYRCASIRLTFPPLSVRFRVPYSITLQTQLYTYYATK